MVAKGRTMNKLSKPFGAQIFSFENFLRQETISNSIAQSHSRTSFSYTMMMQHVPPRSPVRVSTNPNNWRKTSTYKPVRHGRGMTSSAARVRIDRNGTVVRGAELKRSAVRVRVGDPANPCSELLVAFILFLVLFWIAVWFSVW